jgi:hypothetical protein
MCDNSKEYLTGHAKAERLPRAAMKGNGSSDGKVVFTRFVERSSLREEW